LPDRGASCPRPEMAATALILSVKHKKLQMTGAKLITRK
jgi:hypothetical protein